MNEGTPPGSGSSGRRQTADKVKKNGIETHGGCVKGDGSPPFTLESKHNQNAFLIVRSRCRHFGDTLNASRKRQLREAFCTLTEKYGP